MAKGKKTFGKPFPAANAGKKTPFGAMLGGPSNKAGAPKNYGKKGK